MNTENTESFESTYPRYPFAPLVGMAIALGRSIALATRWYGTGITRPARRPVAPSLADGQVA